MFLCIMFQKCTVVITFDILFFSDNPYLTHVRTRKEGERFSTSGTFSFWLVLISYAIRLISFSFYYLLFIFWDVFLLHITNAYVKLVAFGNYFKPCTTPHGILKVNMQLQPAIPASRKQGHVNSQTKRPDSRTKTLFNKASKPTWYYKQGS